VVHAQVLAAGADFIASPTRLARIDGYGRTTTAKIHCADAQPDDTGAFEHLQQTGGDQK
jgi:hypothetical protein